MQLSENFSLAELTVTETGIPNEPSMVEQTKLLYLANFILQPIYDKFGTIRVSSGFRSLALNTKTGGSKLSQCMLGEAAAFTSNPFLSRPSYMVLDEIYAWIVEDSGIPFGQCIRESKDGKHWIHISLPRIDKPNQQALVYDGKEYRPYAG